MDRLFISLCASVVGCALALQFPPAAAGVRSSESVLHSFHTGGDGLYPDAGLADVNGTLYGTTEVGGTHDDGAVFSIDPTTGAEAVVYSFAGDPDGYTPFASPIDVNGTLFGTTAEGGDTNKGTVFSLDPKTGAETVLHSFAGGSDGEIPVASLIAVKGTLYGTTKTGGTVGAGTVFSLDVKTGVETVLHSFGGGTDGNYPEGSLLDVKGALYGTAGLGGAHNYGAVFSLDPATGAESVLYSFVGGTDGVSPVADLIDVKGVLYSTTEAGGAYGHGTVFSLDLTTGAETVLHSFAGGGDGENPYPGLTAVRGRLYGTTYFGGAYNYGTVFEIKKR